MSDGYSMRLSQSNADKTGSRQLAIAADDSNGLSGAVYLQDFGPDGKQDWYRMYGSHNLRTIDVTLKLTELTWVESASGMYYSTDVYVFETEPLSILAVSLAEFTTLRSTDHVTPFIQGGKTISLISNTNTFAGTNAAIVIRILYVAQTLTKKITSTDTTFRHTIGVIRQYTQGITINVSSIKINGETVFPS